MTPDQHLAYQEVLVMQEVLALSAGEDEVRCVSEVEELSPRVAPVACALAGAPQQQQQQQQAATAAP
jgi:hypothetical protein